MVNIGTYAQPIQNIMISATFLLVEMVSCIRTGIGIHAIIRSVAILSPALVNHILRTANFHEHNSWNKFEGQRILTET